MRIRGKDRLGLDDGTYSEITFTAEFPEDRRLLTEFMQWMLDRAKQLTQQADAASSPRPANDGDQELVADMLSRLTTTEGPK
jgi:hypothetical protein